MSVKSAQAVVNGVTINLAYNSISSLWRSCLPSMSWVIIPAT